jgi:hypothetical protein
MKIMKIIRNILFLIFILGAMTLKAMNPPIVFVHDKKAPVPEVIIPNLIPEFPRVAAFNDFPAPPAVNYNRSFIIRIRLVAPEVNISDDTARVEDYSYLAPEVPLEADFE